MKANDWVVCLNSFREPSTWAKIICFSGDSAWVKYGEHAPIWSSSAWSTKFLVPYESEDAAKKIVEDYEERN